MKKVTPSSLKAKPTDGKSKVTHETIQISLVRSVTTTGDTSGGKTSTTTASSGGKTLKLSESRESVKDSSTSYSSSDTEPISLTDVEDETSAGDEDSEYSEEYSDTEPTEPSYGTSSYSSQASSSKITEPTTSLVTAQSGEKERPKTAMKTRRSSRSRALSVKNVPTSDLQSKSTRQTSDYTSFATTITTNSGSLSYQDNTTTSPKTTTTLHSSHHPEGDSTNTVTANVDSPKILEPINENEYIRAKLTLPTNEVISILMKKDQKFDGIFNPPQQYERNVNETGDSNHINTMVPAAGVTNEHVNDQIGNQRTRISQNPLQGGSHGMMRMSKTSNKILKKSSNDSTQRPKNRENIKDPRDQQTMSQIKSSKDKHNEAKEKPVLQNKMNEQKYPLNRNQREQYTLGLEDFSALEKKNEDPPKSSFKMVNSKYEDRGMLQPISFNLPSLPKLMTEKSVSFKINTEIIRERKLKDRSTLSYRRSRDVKKLTKRSNKKHKHAPHQLRKTSSLRCPQFITFGQMEATPETLSKIKSSKSSTVDNDPRDNFNIRRSLRNKKIHKPSEVKSPKQALQDRVPVLHPACSLDKCSLVTLPGISEKSINDKNSIHTANICETIDQFVDPYNRQIPNQKDIQSQINCVLSTKLDLIQHAQYFEHLEQQQEEAINKQHRIAKQQKGAKDEHSAGDKVIKQNHRCDNISPHGITKNYVRFYESNFLPEPASTKYNFQVIRNKFESRENHKQKPEKKSMVSRNTPFNFAKLCRKFSGKSKLNKSCICHGENETNKFQVHNQSRQTAKESHKALTVVKNSAKETFNNLLKEIIDTVERKKSERRGLCVKPKSAKGDERNKDNNVKTDLFTTCKFNDNDTEFKQLQLIFKTVKRAYEKNMRNKTKKALLLQATDELSQESHSSNIGQHLCYIYLKCFSKKERSPYSQNDFVNIRKVVDFFLKYLVFEYKYLHMHTNVGMKNIVYSVYARISQHHFRLKNHLSTSSELADPQNDPWPIKVYDQLTKFNIMVNSNSSNTNYKESNPKLRPSCSTHSEHSIKYFAIDYFLKLLKIIVAQDKDDTTTHDQSNANVSEGTTASSFNSHHYCQMQSGSKTSSHCFKNPLQLDVSPRDTPSYVTLRGAPTNTVETDNESISITTRAQSIKAKLKRFKKRKTRRCFIEKQLNRSLNSKGVRVKQETDLSKFELNRFVLNKTIKGKQLKPYGMSSRTRSKCQPILLQNSNEMLTENSKGKIDNDDKLNNMAQKSCTSTQPVVVVYNAMQQSQLSQPPPPPPPLKSKDETEYDNANLIDEVSNLVNKIVKYNKNVNLDKIKEQINFILELNSSGIDESNKEGNIEEKNDVQLKKPNVTHDTHMEKNNQDYVKQEDNEGNQNSSQQVSNRELELIRNSLIEQIKQNINAVRPPTRELRNHSTNKDPPVSRPSLFIDVKKRETMIPVNMAKNLIHKEVEWKKENKQRESKEKDYIAQKVRGNELGIAHEKCNKEQSVVFPNQQLFNNVIRNKVISNKINQKIMELTKNMSMEITKPIIIFEEKPLENKPTITQTKPESHTHSTKLGRTDERKFSPSMSDLEEWKSTQESNKKKKSKDFRRSKETHASPVNQQSTKMKPKPPIISNDDLFFTNRRRHSVFNRPFRSILGFESDLLSDVRDSDEDLSIHEIYVKKPYYRNESKSCTDQNEHDRGSAIGDSARKGCTAKDTKEKFLTKKQQEVFNKLRTMYQEEVEGTSFSNQIGAKCNPVFDTSEDNIITKCYNTYIQPINEKRPRHIGRRSRSQSDIYQYENLSSFSMKNCRSSETIFDSK